MELFFKIWLTLALIVLTAASDDLDSRYNPERSHHIALNTLDISNKLMKIAVANKLRNSFLYSPISIATPFHVILLGSYMKTFNDLMGLY